MKSLHIFKAGKHTDTSGQVLKFSEADLIAMSNAYDPALHEAPIVIGHPKDNSPAYGWVAKLTADKSGLYASTKQVPVEFSEVVANGAYKKVSASFYAPDSPQNPKPGTYYLRHVGFLGAQPPAIKGLSAISFSEDEEGVVEVSAESGTGLFKKLRDWLIANKGQEVADDILPEAKAKLLEQQKAAENSDNPTIEPVVSATDNADDVVAQLTETLVAQEEQIQSLIQEKETLETEVNKQTSEEAASFAEKLVREGRLLPKHKAAVVAFMEFAAGKKSKSNGVLSFGEGASERPLLPAFKSFLNGLPKSIDFGEAATRHSAMSSPNNPLLADAERRNKK